MVHMQARVRTLVPELVLSMAPATPAPRSLLCNQLPPEQWPSMLL
jgi:hypothetical protein